MLDYRLYLHSCLEAVVSKMVRAQDVMSSWGDSFSLQILEPLLLYRVPFFSGNLWKLRRRRDPGFTWCWPTERLLHQTAEQTKAWRCDLRILMLNDNVRLFHCSAPLKTRINSMTVCQLFRKSLTSPLLSVRRCRFASRYPMVRSFSRQGARAFFLS